MPAPAAVRRVARVGNTAEAEGRLYQALYGCTMHPGGLLHAIAAILAAEHEGRLTLTAVAARVADQARAALDHAEPADAWRFETMIDLCHRLSTSP